jgi:hypothetical protein
MNQRVFESKEEFTVKELAELFDRTVVRVWQVLNDGKIPFWSRMADKVRRDITVPKEHLEDLMKIFKTDVICLEQRGRPYGQKNKPGHKAGRPRLARRPGRPVGSKNKQVQVTA